MPAGSTGLSDPAARRPAGSRILDVCGVGLYLFLVVCFCGRAYFRPGWNWDVVGYIGAALSLGRADATFIHAETYRAVRDAVPPARFEALVGSRSDYQHRMADDHEEFSRELPLYLARPLYVVPIRILAEMGLNPARATVAVSAFSSLVCSVILLVWIRRHWSGWMSSLLAGCLTVTSGTLACASMSTPDTLSAAVLLISAFLMFERKAIIWALVIADLSILARTDNLPYALALGFASAPTGHRPAWDRGRILRLLAKGVAPVSVYLMVQGLSGHPGWLFMLRRTLDIGAGSESGAGLLAGYTRALEETIGFVPEAVRLAGFLLLGLLALAATRSTRSQSPQAGMAIPVACCAALARFVALPVLWDRLLIGAYALVGVGALALMTPRDANPPRRARSPRPS